MTRKIITYSAYSLILFIGITLWLWLKCPQYLMYHEQYQLFLFTGDYFLNSIAIPGGFADYISEFIVQFYYVPLYGALLSALVLTLSQVFLGLSLRGCALPDTAYAMAALPSLLYLGAMADENMLLSYAVAMLLTSLFIYLFTLRENSSTLACTIALTIGFALLYWLAGPFALVFISAGGILRRSPVATAMAFAAAFAMVWTVNRIWFQQYPLSRLLLGVNYYRVPEIYPLQLYLIAAATVAVSCFQLRVFNSLNLQKKPRKANYQLIVSTAALAIFAALYIPSCFNEEKSRVLAYDSLVRHGKWNEIIAKADKENPSDNFSLQAVNLALGMTGRLTDNMFRYNQQGLESLIGKSRLDNTTQLITAETLFRLGLTNIAFSTTFDLQEAIMNDRKSGRLMKRMAECMLINGNYKAASKYIGLLRNSLCYSDWAKQAETLLDNDKGVEAHPVYGPMRRNAFKKVAFYDYTQLDKILAIHAVDSDGANSLAWQYFCAASMLKGDLQTLTGAYDYSSRHFTGAPVPRHIQEALAMYWTFSHPTFDSVPFPLSQDVKQRTAALAQAVMQSQSNPAAWQAAAPGSFGVYFLNNSRKQHTREETPQYQHTHE